MGSSAPRLPSCPTAAGCACDGALPPRPAHAEQLRGWVVMAGGIHNLRGALASSCRQPHELLPMCTCFAGRPALWDLTTVLHQCAAHTCCAAEPATAAPKANGKAESAANGHATHITAAAS